MTHSNTVDLNEKRLAYQQHADQCRVEGYEAPTFYEWLHLPAAYSAPPKLPAPLFNCPCKECLALRLELRKHGIINSLAGVVDYLTKTQKRKQP